MLRFLLQSHDVSFCRKRISFIRSLNSWIYSYSPSRMVLYQWYDSRLICCLIVDRYRSVMVLPVWSNITLIISLSEIRLMVKAATIDLIVSLSFRGNLGVLLYSPLRKIKFRASGVECLFSLYYRMLDLLTFGS